MSDLDLTGCVDLDDILEKLKEMGATITWPAEAASRSQSIEFDVTIDADDAAEALPSRYFNHGDEPEYLDPDPLDVRDFVGACLRGDRTVAAALLPRVVGPAGAQDAAERALQLGGRA